MSKYEISLWEDYPEYAPSTGEQFLYEKKLCVIGSDTMHTTIRAIEPKMVTNINGTHTFTFKMYYWYTDEFTGEKIINPFGSLLINERKVKVYWEDQWYDMIIKSLDENTQDKSITYTCKDLFITELSKNGYNLEFTADLQNNIGTASELAAQVLEGSGWQFDSVNSTKIIQKTEEPVYEVNTTASFSATKQSPNGDTTATIPSGKKVLVFYSSILDITDTTWRAVDIQFLYSADGYATDENDMFVTNGDCYVISATAQRSNGYVNVKVGNTTVMSIGSDVSTKYRAERLVKSQITKYDELFDRYVNVYRDSSNSNKEVWGYSRTEFSDPTMVLNLVANPNEFTSLDGWIGDNLTYGVYPKFGRTTDITTYGSTVPVHSYLKVNSGWTYNNGLTANQSFLKPSQGDIKDGETGGFHVGDRYIFRIKFKNGDDPSAGSYQKNTNIQPGIYKYNSSFEHTGSAYFSVGSRTTNGDWNEYVLTCSISCPATEIQDLGIFLNASASYWVEDAQFFKEEYGVTSYSSTTPVRMNPGEVSLQGISKTIYRYYDAEHITGYTPASIPIIAQTAEEVKFLYEGEDQPARFVPVTNNYEKLATIEAKNSNRFNILQSIAESFNCWVRFTIQHDATGKTVLVSGLPQKYVTLVEYVGTDLGWSFEYGIDLKTIQRKVISDDIVTKVIVLPNENEFGKNGFCSIARSKYNYSKENFILNFDYFINQGLLDKELINRDLYGTSYGYIGYLYNLHNLNTEYDAITSILTQKRMEYTKQNSQLIVVTGQQKATREKIDSCKSDIMTLACVTTWAAAQAYVREHSDNTKVQSLMNTIAQLQNTYNKNESVLSQLTSSINTLKNYIDQKVARQETILTTVENLHKRFFKKYSRYIQEGTWQDSDYSDDDKYYLDAVDVAYTSSRPQIQYTINVMRLNALEDYSSKKFDVGDICYIQDREYFGYNTDGITPYKLKIIISEITSYLDEPQKDQIKVQNYKTQFDDLFQRITATTQSLQYAQGGYEKAAGTINHDKTLNFGLLQETFDYNQSWVLNASNQHVTWDETGLTVTDDNNAALQVKLMAGGLFISNDGGATWKNAVRGDGISTDVLTAGRVNTSEIFVYDGNHPSFRWDSAGIDAYYYDATSTYFNKYIRFDKFGIYGYKGSDDFRPATEDEIWYKTENNTLVPNDDVRFGLTWKGFFMHGDSGISGLEIKSEEDSQGNSQIRFVMTSSTQTSTSSMPVSLEISTDHDIVLKTKSHKVGNTYYDVDRIQIGRLQGSGSSIADYGIWVRDADGNNIFNVSAEGVDTIGGWNLTRNSFYHTAVNGDTLGLFAEGKNWTILGPSSTSADITNKQHGGNPQANTGKPSAGDTHDYYIIAGNKFGVTLDGEVYSSGGRIGGWYITEKKLYSDNIQFDSTGNIRCTVAPLNPPTAHPIPAEGVIYIVADNKAILSGSADPTFTYSITTTLTGRDSDIKNAANISISKGTQISGTNNYNIVVTGNNSITLTVSGIATTFQVIYINAVLYVTSSIWNIDNSGHAYFHDIEADGGYIAGWHIDDDAIWNDDGTKLSAAGDAVYETNRYTIVTNSIAASGGNIGGWGINPGFLGASGVGLYSDGKITFGNARIEAYNGGIGIYDNLYVNGVITALYSIHTGSSLFATDDLRLGNSESPSILEAGDIDGLHGWKKGDGSYYTPSEVRTGGANSVYVNQWYVNSGSTYWDQDTTLYLPISITADLYYVDLDGNNQDRSDVSEGRDLDVTSIWYDGWNSKACDSCCPSCNLDVGDVEYNGHEYYVTVSCGDDSETFYSAGRIH